MNSVSAKIVKCYLYHDVKINACMMEAFLAIDSDHIFDYIFKYKLPLRTVGWILFSKTLMCHKLPRV